MANRVAFREYSRDGRIYPICRACLAVIAAAHKDAELTQPEANHVCAPLDLGLFTRAT